MSDDTIDDELAAWIREQQLFFVGTAPLDPGGHVNVSPKGPIGTFAVLGPKQVAYLDFFGSGAETVAHLRENGRIVVMLCAFDGEPQTVRIHGRGTPLWPGSDEFDDVLARSDFSGLTDVDEARRAIVLVDVDLVSTSPGYTVPLMEHLGEREHFDLAKRKRLQTMGPERLRQYQAEGNAESVDGLPAVPPDDAA